MNECSRGFSLLSLLRYTLQWISLYRSRSKIGNVQSRTSISRASPAYGWIRHPWYMQCWLRSSRRWCRNWGPTVYICWTTNHWFHHCTDHSRSCRYLGPWNWTSSHWRLDLDDLVQQLRLPRLRWIQTRPDGTCQPADRPRTTNIRPSTTVRCLAESEHMSSFGIYVTSVKFQNTNCFA